MAVKHTKGPWRVHTTDSTAIIDRTGADIAATTGDYENEYEAMEANARLIAAAPDLLEMLKEARKCLRRCHYAGPEREAIDAAILKATGEA